MLKSSLDEETEQRWNNFVNGPLADQNRKNETNLVSVCVCVCVCASIYKCVCHLSGHPPPPLQGGNRPVASSMDDSDEEFDQLTGGLDSELEKVN